MPTGKVKWYDARKGYGFIQDDGGGPDVFVGEDALRSSRLDSLSEGQAVEFATESTPKGPKVVSIKSLDS